MLYDHYKKLHAIPELGFKEYKTQAYILKHLSKTKAIISTYKTAVLGFFDFKKSKTIAFRCELDALPIKEETGLDFASRHIGKMHACGHDSHMAMLLELSNYINQLKDYKYNVLLVFQPSEEVLGGSLFLLPYLRHYSYTAFVGLHVFPCLKKGEIYASYKPVFASSTEIDIIARGKEIHIASYKNKYDALKIGFKEARRLENEARLHNLLFHVGMMRGGNRRNICAFKAILKGTLRGLKKEDNYQFINTFLTNNGNNITYKISKTIPETKSDFLLLKKMKEYLKINLLDKTYYQAEDFGFYPSSFHPLFFLLGTGNKTPLHDSSFYLKEDILNYGASFYKDLISYFQVH